MNTPTQSLLSRALELEQRGRALAQKRHEHTEFCKSVVALLTERGANTIGELPMADQQALAERGAGLIPDAELESERAELERLECELWAQLPHDVFPVH